MSQFLGPSDFEVQSFPKRLSRLIQSLVFKDSFITYFPETEADKMLWLVYSEYKVKLAEVTYRSDPHNLGATGRKESNPRLDLSMMSVIPEDHSKLI